VGVRLILREKVFVVGCALVLLSAIVAFAMPHGHALTTIGDITQSALQLLVLFTFLDNARRAEQRTKAFWALMSLGSFFWCSTQLLWTYFEVFLRQEVPNPFVGDVILFLHLVPMMAALAMQPDVDASEPTSRVGSLDFALLLMWWLYLYLFLVIPWQYISPNSAIYGSSFDLLYLLEHFVFVACVAALWIRSTGNWRVVYGHFLGASLVYAVVSIAASFAIDLGTYYTGSAYDIPLVLAISWFAATGVMARKVGLRTDESKIVDEKRRGWLSGLAMLTILSLPAMAGWALYASGTPDEVRTFRVKLTLVTMMAMGTVTWLKQRRLDKQLALANRELREDSLTDALTGAKNRRFFASTIDADAKQALRAYACPNGTAPKRNQDLAFYLIDADCFKEVNDRYGHDAGDALLVQIARRISSAIRYSDVLIRWGGDEFLVLSRFTDREDSASLAERVLNALAGEPFQLASGATIRTTCSIGWSVFPWFVDKTEVIPHEEALRIADCALYEAKKLGRNRAIGMLPTAKKPTGESLKPSGKSGRWSEQLGAQMLTIKGTDVPRASTLVARSLAASTS